MIMDPTAPMITASFKDMMQVCVPAKWTKSGIVNFANKEIPSSKPWKIRNLTAQDKVHCTVREGFIHYILVNS